jgi:Tol biopolymer transport system component
MEIILAGEVEMSREIQFIGWGGLDIRLGKVSSGAAQVTPLILDWQPGDIRNCSYAPVQGWVGITAEDRTHGRQVLAVYDSHAHTTRFLMRTDNILRHSFKRTGTEVCYTQPSKQTGAADLYLYELHSGESHRIAEAAVAHGSTPVWFPDDQWIAYHSPGGQIELLDTSKGQRKILIDGLSPTVSQDGERIAFYRDDQLFIWSQASQGAQRLEIKPMLRKPRLVDGLSWSPDGNYLSFGVVAGLTDKRTDFYLLDLASGENRKVEAKYLRGLVIIARGSG